MIHDAIAAILSGTLKVSVAGREPSIRGSPEAAQAGALAQLAKVTQILRGRPQVEIAKPSSRDEVAWALSDLIGCFKIEEKTVVKRAHHYVAPRALERASARKRQENRPRLFGRPHPRLRLPVPRDRYMGEVFRLGHEQVRATSLRMECMQ